MKRLFVIVLLCLVGWQAYVRYEAKRLPATQAPVPAIATPPATQPAAVFPGAPASPTTATASPFKCDGRTYCSQMRSCAEATFFLKNCPGAKMDGNNDGIPCEKQWCK